MIPLSFDEIVEAVGGSVLRPVSSFPVRGISIDSRTIGAGELFVAVAGENFDGHDFVKSAFKKGASGAVVRRGFEPPDELSDNVAIVAVDDTVDALTRLARRQRERIRATVIAVTGSNGKTTTKGMLDQVLGRFFPGRAAPKSFNNAIGVPLTLLSAEAADRYLVVEIGSSSPGEVAAMADIARPDVGVVTSIGRAHLEGLGSLEGVAAEKLSLLGKVAPRGLGVVNLDDLKASGAELPDGGAKVITFGRDTYSDIRISGYESNLHQTRFSINERFTVEMPVPGLHNALNAAAVFAVARRLHLDPEDIVAALGQVKLPDMRLSVIELDGLTLVEDCYNANPTSMASAIELLGGLTGRRRVLVAGEMRELGPEAAELHRQVGRQAGEAGIEVIIGIGPFAEVMLQGAGGRPAAGYAFGSTGEACEAVPELLADGDVVLVKGSRAGNLEKLAGAIKTRQSGRSPFRPAESYCNFRTD